MPPEARRHIAEDHIAWLTTVTDSGAPAPNPVWFVPDGDDLVVFSAPGSRKVHNIAERPTVTLNFNSDRTAPTSSSSTAPRRRRRTRSRAACVPISTSTRPASPVNSGPRSRRSTGSTAPNCGSPRPGCA
ncbi:pyridoxamine 5'-phosphate oxidase family protein [Rhodococcus sp. PvR044]|uniref:pyridoxamine 5'-phosphate oxidase family protein n=1 Tax=Rhodococcus sp. PvR044 TaxID=3156402 RepID=UPI00339687BC